MISYSIFHIEQKRFNYFFVDFLKNCFGRVEIMLTMVERECIFSITRQICSKYFIERYFRGISWISRNSTKISPVKNTCCSQLRKKIPAKKLFPGNCENKSPRKKLLVFAKLKKNHVNWTSGLSNVDSLILCSCDVPCPI